jgi:hypothetical protein
LEALPAAESRAGSRASCSRFAHKRGRLVVYDVILTFPSPGRSCVQ